MGFTAAGIATDTVSTTQLAPLGFELTVPTGDNGLQTWVYVKADTEALVVGDVCMQTSTTRFNVKEVTGAKIPADQLVGVAQHAIPLNSYGFIIKRGYADYVFGDGSVTAGSSVISASNNGDAKNANLANADEVAAVFGLALANDASATVGGVTRVLFAAAVDFRG